ncbi:JmjC domain-containing protein [Kitasatospora sp. NPDC059673]|uniref:JmjC domain-containing protein n=1 Tax=Kitasatospora sp. NPDC059673 TaxID=3346901 RepID=UPI0036A26E43
MDWLDRCVDDTETFLRRHWRQGPVVLRPADPPTEVLTVESLFDLIDEGTLRDPYAGLFTVEGTVPQEEYCPPRVIAGKTLEGCLDPERVRALIRDRNATLQLRYLNHWHPGVRALTTGLSESLGRLTEAFMFYSQPGRHGPVHRDEGDILVIQLSGNKHWQVYGGPTDPNWQPVREDNPGPCLLDTVIHPGEVLYVPNGYAHTARATEDGPSLHLTIALREACSVHLRTQLRALLTEGLELPARPRDEDDLLEAGSQLLDHLRTRLATANPAELVSAARRAAYSSRPTA